MVAKQAIKNTIEFAARSRQVRECLTLFYRWWRTDAREYNVAHPFDQSLGIDASGTLPNYLTRIMQPRLADVA
jgi:hypothetical protein